MLPILPKLYPQALVSYVSIGNLALIFGVHSYSSKWDRDKRGIRVGDGVPSKEMEWEIFGGSRHGRQPDSGKDGVYWEGACELLGGMSSHKEALMSGVLRITMSHVLY